MLRQWRSSFLTYLKVLKSLRRRAAGDSSETLEGRVCLESNFFYVDFGEYPASPFDERMVAMFCTDEDLGWDFYRFDFLGLQQREFHMRKLM